MQLSIEIPLKTYEVYKLFRLKIGNKRFFIEAVLRKLNTIYIQPEIYQQVEKELQALTVKFIEEADHLEKILNKNPSIQVNTIRVSARFHPKIMASNKPCLLLVEFIKVYDNLITLIKLIHLTACFDSDNAYYANLNRVQKMGNNMLSQILLLQKQKTL